MQQAYYWCSKLREKFHPSYAMEFFSPISTSYSSLPLTLPNLTLKPVWIWAWSTYLFASKYKLLLVVSPLEKKKPSIPFPRTLPILAVWPPEDAKRCIHRGHWMSTWLIISYDFGPMPSWLPAVVTGLVWVQNILLSGLLCHPATPPLLHVVLGRGRDIPCGRQLQKLREGQLEGGKRKWEEEKKTLVGPPQEVNFCPRLFLHEAYP